MYFAFRPDIGWAPYGAIAPETQRMVYPDKPWPLMTGKIPPEPTEPAEVLTFLEETRRFLRELDPPLPTRNEDPTTEGR